MNLFKYSKQGILLIYGFTTINLTELFMSDPDNIYEILDNLLEQDLDTNQRQIVNEVKKDFRRGWIK